MSDSKLGWVFFELYLFLVSDFQVLKQQRDRLYLEKKKISNNNEKNEKNENKNENTKIKLWIERENEFLPPTSAALRPSAFKTVKEWSKKKNAMNVSSRKTKRQ